jgi:putative component of toxin-antitoxin plasmid stabilization module
MRDGDRLILLLCGASKFSQDRDIQNARLVAKEWKSSEQED